MQKEEKFVNSLIKTAKHALKELGNEHCICFKDIFEYKNYDLKTVQEFAKKAGYQFVSMDEVEEYKKLPDAHLQYVLMKI